MRFDIHIPTQHRPPLQSISPISLFEFQWEDSGQFNHVMLTKKIKGTQCYY